MRLVIIDAGLPGMYAVLSTTRDSVSNMPRSHVLSSEPLRDTPTLQVDLSPATGLLSYNLLDVSGHRKKKQYCGRTRAVISRMLQMQVMRRALQHVMADLSNGVRDNQEFRVNADLACDRGYNIIHPICRSKVFEDQSRDHAFGLGSMREYWQGGLNDMRQILAHPRSPDSPLPEFGVITHVAHRKPVRSRCVGIS